MTPDTNHPDFLSNEASGSAFRVRPLSAVPPEPKRPKKTPRWLYVALGIFGIILVAGLIAGSGEDTDQNSQAGFLGRIKQLVLSGDRKLASEDGKYTNILLLGMGGAGHDGPYLTDTIILARLDLKQKRIALFSIPRDLLVNIPGHGWWRVNNANAFGETKQAGTGPDLVKQTIEQTLDVPVHYYVRIDFKGFEKVIDSLGGVTVDVERAFTDAKYPAGPNEFQTVRFDSGRQTMDGEEALIFTRSRHGDNNEGSDFARAARQQKILMAVRSRVLSPTLILNPARLTGLYRSLNDSLASNMSTGEIAHLIDTMRDISGDAISMHVFDDAPDGELTAQILEDGAYVLVPKKGYETLRLAIVNAFGDGGATSRVLAARTPTPPPPKRDAPPAPTVWVLNGTKIEGLAARMSMVLKDQGFLVTNTSNAPDQTVPHTRVVPLTATGQAQLPAIVAILDPAIDTNLPPQMTQPPKVDLVIILGPDANTKL